jgi:hypothetical protein
VLWLNRTRSINPTHQIKPCVKISEMRPTKISPAVVTIDSLPDDILSLVHLWRTVSTIVFTGITVHHIKSILLLNTSFDEDLQASRLQFFDEEIYSSTHKELKNLNLPKLTRLDHIWFNFNVGFHVLCRNYFLI